MPPTDLSGDRTIELDVRGMTCASCAVRIERKLNKMDGVALSVSYATEKATARVQGPVETDALIGAIQQAGYDAELPAVTPHDPEHDLRALGRRVIIAAALSAPVLLTSMIVGLQFPWWQWIALP